MFKPPSLEKRESGHIKQLCDSLHGCIYKLPESVHVIHGKICQDLAVNINSGNLQPVYEAAVVGSTDARSCIDTRDPQLAIFP